MIVWVKRLWAKLVGRDRSTDRIFMQSRQFEDRPELYTKPDEPDTVRGNLAYAFRSGLTLEEMLQSLNAHGPWRWIERDSYWEGDYLSATVKSNSAMLKIFEEEDSFVLNLFYKARGPQAVQGWDQLHDAMLREILPSLDAMNVEKTESYDTRLGWGGPASEWSSS